MMRLLHIIALVTLGLALTLAATTTRASESNECATDFSQSSSSSSSGEQRRQLDELIRGVSRVRFEFRSQETSEAACRVLADSIRSGADSRQLAALGLGGPPELVDNGALLARVGSLVEGRARCSPDKGGLHLLAAFVNKCATSMGAAKLPPSAELDKNNNNNLDELKEAQERLRRIAELQRADQEASSGRQQQRETIQSQALRAKEEEISRLRGQLEALEEDKKRLHQHQDQHQDQQQLRQQFQEEREREQRQHQEHMQQQQQQHQREREQLQRHHEEERQRQQDQLEQQLARERQQFQRERQQLQAQHEQSRTQVARAKEEELARVRGELEATRASLREQQERAGCQVASAARAKDDEIARLQGELAAAEVKFDSLRGTCESQTQELQARVREREASLDAARGTNNANIAELKNKIESLRRMQAESSGGGGASAASLREAKTQVALYESSLDLVARSHKPGLAELVQFLTNSGEVLRRADKSLGYPNKVSDLDLLIRMQATAIKLHIAEVQTCRKELWRWQHGTAPQQQQQQQQMRPNSPFMW